MALAETARYLRIGKLSLYKMARRGKIPKNYGNDKNGGEKRNKRKILKATTIFC